MPSTKAFKDQKYSELKKRALSSGQLFTDPEFAADDRALYYSTSGKSKTTEWKRPKDISSDPRFFADGISHKNLKQGELGNCWFVAACSCLAMHKNIWTKVIPDHRDQEWDPKKADKYAGIFHFRFWRYGEWIDVVIDDLLPTRHGRLVYASSAAENEFWLALLEKAYAKLIGCYEALCSGDLSEALEDFTGGVSETLDIVDKKCVDEEKKKDDFFKYLVKEMDHGSLMSASLPAKSADQREQKTDVGLVRGHAYSITAARKITMLGTGLFKHFNREKIDMIRLRNPWGGCEWTGDFSDNSPIWERITKSDRKKMGLTFDDDGEFWMTYDDFCKHFSEMAICRAVNTSIGFKKRWHETSLHSEWTKPDRAGGCINNKTTFCKNPQFAFDIAEEDEALVQLIQKTSRAKDEDKLSIGFTIMKVEENRQFRTHSIQTFVVSSSYTNTRSVFLRHHFVQGRYILVACTFDPAQIGRFLLRIYTGTSTPIRELTLDKPKKQACSCFPSRRYPQCITRIKIVKADGFDIRSLKAYCVISCEGQRVTTPVSKNGDNPEWNTTAVFYRKNPTNKPITVSVYNSVLGRDDFLGSQSFDETDDVNSLSLSKPLLGKKKNVQTGRLTVVLTTTKDMFGL